MKIILASTSPRRKEIMALTGLKFQIVNSDYVEDMTIKMPPKKLVAYLSLGKAQAVAKKYKNAIIIAADSIVSYQGRVFGKPKSKLEAKNFLQILSGNTHSTITGFTIINTATGQKVSKAVEIKIKMKKISNTEIDNYIKTGEPLDKAGAYAMQGLGSLFVESISGNYYGAVGLPIFHVAEELRKFGIIIL